MEVFERFSKHWTLAQKHFVPFIFLMEMFAKKSENQSLFDTVVNMLIKNFHPETSGCWHFFSFTILFIYNPQYLTIPLPNYILRVTSIMKTYTNHLHTIILDTFLLKMLEHFCYFLQC